MANNKYDRWQLEAEINQKARSDSKFKQLLLTKPKNALAKLGLKNIPASLNIKVEVEPVGTWIIVLVTPKTPPAGMVGLECAIPPSKGCGCSLDVCADG